MGKPEKKQPGKLVEAAMALEEELRRTGDAAREALRSRLDSSRNLELTAAKLAELGTFSERLQPLVNALMAAVKELVDAQQSQTEQITARAAELLHRKEVFQRLMERYGALAQAARDLNNLVQAFADARRPGGTASASNPPTLEILQRTMAELIENARQVSQAGKQEQFDDIARQADTLRQQVQTSLNKLNLLADLPAGQSSLN